MKVVGIGGGHGLATTLRAARHYASQVAAVVTVADDGGSSGRLTAELGIPPPGDIRNCLVALSDGELADMFQHRFGRGTLEGHPIGNLMIAALAEMHGDFATAVAEAGRLLDAQGEVFPATSELVQLSAEVEGGVIEGQVAVARTPSPIHSIHLHPPDPAAHPAGVAALKEADQIVVGPGSLFTSVIATLLVPGIRDALRLSRAERVFVCNTRRQPGETEDLSVAGHVEALLRHAERGIDAVIVQDPALSDAMDVEEWPFEDVELVRADVAGPEGAHDPEKLAAVLEQMPGPRPGATASSVS